MVVSTQKSLWKIIPKIKDIKTPLSLEILNIEAINNPSKIAGTKSTKLISNTRYDFLKPSFGLPKISLYWHKLTIYFIYFYDDETLCCGELVGFFETKDTTDPKTPTTSKAPPRYSNHCLYLMVVNPDTLILAGVSGIRPGPFNGGV